MSVGRESIEDQIWALAFIAGADSIFFGQWLLTSGNPEARRDARLLARQGLEAAALQR